MIGCIVSCDTWEKLTEAWWSLACVIWRFWLGGLSNKGGRGQRNREEIGAEATWFLFFSLLGRSFSRASRANFAATPLLRPARQNRHVTQARWSLTAFSKWRFKLKHAETGPPAQNSRLLTCISSIYIFILYLYLNMITISLNMNGTQQKKLIRLQWCL